MKKRALLLIVLLISVCSIVALSACNRETLPAPEGLEINEAARTIMWDEVPYSTGGYLVDINGKTHNTSINEFSLKDITAPGEYVIKVKALTIDKNFYKNSDWSKSETYIIEQLGLTYKLINDDSEYEVIGRGFSAPEVIIPSTYNNRPITSIGDYALSNFTGLEKITIGKNITRIGSSAFYNCTTLKEIVFLTENLTTIGNRAFSSCRGFSSITIPDTVTSIGEYAFAYCRGLIEIEIPKNITTISNHVFTDCEKLEEVRFKGAVTDIEDYAFTNCNKLERIEIPNTVTTIGSDVFAKCQSLKSMTIPQGVTLIGDRAFYGCTLLSNISLPATLINLGLNCFDDSQVFKSAQTKDGVVYVDNWAVKYRGDEEQTEVEIIEGTIGLSRRVFGGAGFIKEITLPQSLKVIGVESFIACNGLIDIIIPDNVQYLERGAFSTCSGLKTVKIGDGITFIDEDVFFNCTVLKEVELGQNIEYIGSYAFSVCPNLDTINIPVSVKRIGTYAFMNTKLWENSSIVYIDNWLIDNKNIDIEDPLDIREGTVGIADYALYESSHRSVSIPSSVKYIGRGAFDGHGLTSVRIPDGVTAIMDYTFRDCHSLMTVIIPQSVTSIGRMAFYNCPTLINIIISDNVTSLGDYAFYDCKNLENVSLGRNITSIGERTFSGCNKLSRLTFSDEITSIGNSAFRDCVSLKEFNFPSTLNSIGEHAFRGCTGLKELILPDSLTFLGKYAFYDCENIESLIIGDALTAINIYAFYGCRNLSDVTMGQKVSLIGAYAFRNCNSLSVFTLTKNITVIGPHAFNGCNRLTFFNIASSAFNAWSLRWNSSSRPVIHGSSFDENNIFESFIKTKKSITNLVAVNGISAPLRYGYAFIGWSLTEEGSVKYSTEDIIAQYDDIEENTTLWAVWTPLEIRTYQFESYGGNKIPDVIDYMVIYKYTNIPTREGWIFSGWFDNDDLEGEEVGFPYFSTQDKTTLYAKWIKAGEESES